MAVTLVSPYTEPQPGPYVWLKGNLHSHSTLSDGRRPPQAVIDTYAALGHHFFALSDHDVLTDYSGLDARGMILIRANEVSMSGNHIQHVSATVRVDPAPERQKVIDAIVADGGLAVINHPSWQEHFNHCSYEKLLELKNYVGMEVFNGLCLRHPGSGYAVDKWDRVLATGRMVWGFANDDSHSVDDDGYGWNVVRVPADAVNAASIIDALRAGRFYASTGVTIEKVETNGAQVTVVAPNAQAIEVIGELGRRVAYVEKTELTFDASEITGSVLRVQCHGAGGRFAWTQPFVVNGGRGEQMRKLTQHRPVLKAQRVNELPKLTGAVDGAAWKQAQEGAVFYTLGDGTPPEVSTGVRCLLTKTHIMIGVRCEEPLMENLKVNCRDGDPNLWSDDSIEVFLDVEGKAAHYFQFCVNALGFSSVAHNAKPLVPAYECKAARNEKGWSAELKIALNSLGATDARRWGLHICRNRMTVHQRYWWAWVGSTNHNVTAYGHLDL